MIQRATMRILITIVLSAVLITYVSIRWWPHRGICRWVTGCHIRFPLILEFPSGISPCPLFLLAISYTLDLADLVKGTLFFGSFFVGTSVYLTVLMPLGYLGRWQVLHQIGVMTTMISGVFFFLMGIARLMSP